MAWASFWLIRISSIMDAQAAPFYREFRTSSNREAKKSGRGVRILSCLLPKQSPWLNSIEPKWIHGKRRVKESDRLLSAHELVERVCLAFDCPHYEHLSIPEKVA